MRQMGASSLIAILGSRGGVGTTTLAVNLAATLASDSANAAALIDLDLALGDADIALEVTGFENISISDLARNIERLDMSFLRRAMALHQPTNLSVLRHPLEMHEIGVIHEGHVERILNLLKISYNFLILDLSKGLQPTDLLALRLADLILCVGQLELSSLRNVVRLLHTLTLEDNLAEKVQIVINRVGMEHGDDGIRVSVLCPQAVRTAMILGSDEGGVAGGDGVLEPSVVAQVVVDAIREGRFLILPHEQVLTYMQRALRDGGGATIHLATLHVARRRSRPVRPLRPDDHRPGYR